MVFVCPLLTNLLTNSIIESLWKISVFYYLFTGSFTSRLKSKLFVLVFSGSLVNKEHVWSVFMPCCFNILFLGVKVILPKQAQ